MTNPNVVIRQARAALRLLLSGAVKEGAEEIAVADELFDELSCLVPNGEAGRADAMIATMQNMLGSDTCPRQVRELMAKHDLEP